MVDFRRLLEESRARREGREPRQPWQSRAAHDAEDRLMTDLARADAELEELTLPVDGPHIPTPPAEPDPTPDSDDDEPVPEVLDTETNFLCGAAGVGKTYMARKLIRKRRGGLLCATTGIAAVNLGDATTINSALGYYDTASLVENYTSGRLMATLSKLFKSGVRRLYVDEVSMMDAKQLTVLVSALEELALKPTRYVRDIQLADDVTRAMQEEGDDIQVNWPIKLTMIGDFAQLPPVKAPFAFESEEWPKLHANQHRLTTVRRQADAAFIAALHAARAGRAEEVVEFFRHRLVSGMDDHFAGPTIFGTNDAVDRFNKLRLGELKTPLVRFPSTRWGKLRSEWTKNIPETCDLKVGAEVMILNNKREPLTKRMIYANGDVGEVYALDLDKKECWVTLHRNKQTVQVDYLERVNVIPLEPGRVKELKAAGRDDLIERDADDRPRKEKIGGITYLPVRLAYATTVHKAQGLSFDTCQINTREGMFRNPGMMYVALSRARTAEGLRLIGSVDGLAARCTVDARVTPWL